MPPIDRLLTPALSRDLVKLLVSQGWSLADIGTAIRASDGFLKRVRAGVQNFSERDIKTLARANRTEPFRLLFEALEPSARKSGGKELYESTKRLLASSAAFRESLRHQTVKKRRAKTKAA